MGFEILPILLFVVAAVGVSVTMVGVGQLIGPSRSGRVKEMPYESGMDPIHDARRRFDVRFHIVAIAFLVFDVELLFLYPWAVASRPWEKSMTEVHGIESAIRDHLVQGRMLVFGEVMVFVALLALGFVYAWRKGVFRWH
jgi:NADH-quinone oxidoreductase subunit A